jgi:hypothetical protein
MVVAAGGKETLLLGPMSGCIAGWSQDSKIARPLSSRVPSYPPSLPPPPSLARCCNPDAFVAGRDLTNWNGINSAIGFRKLMVCLDRFTWSLQAVTSFEPLCWSFVCRCAGSDWKFVATNGTTTTQNPTSNLARPVTQPQAPKCSSPACIGTTGKARRLLVHGPGDCVCINRAVRDPKRRHLERSQAVESLEPELSSKRRGAAQHGNRY